MALPKFLSDALFPVAVPEPASANLASAIAGLAGVVRGLDAVAEAAGPVIVTFELELQLGEEWCWAAVALGLHNRSVALGQTTLRYESQCDVAHAILGGNCGAKNPSGVCLSPARSCDRPIRFLDEIGRNFMGFIQRLDLVIVPGLLQLDALAFFQEVLQPAIDAQDVVVARLDRGIDQGHVVVVYGYDLVDDGRVYVADPQGPSSNPEPATVASFLTACKGTRFEGNRVDEVYRAFFHTP